VVIGAIVAAVLLLGGIAYAVSQSGGSNSASSSSSSDSSDSSDSTDATNDFPISSQSSFTDDEATATASKFVETLFTFDETDVSGLHDRLKPLVTSDFLNTLDGSLNAEFSSSVESQGGSASGTTFNPRVQGFNGDSGTILVDATLFFFDSSSSADFPTVTLLVSVTTVDGKLLVSDLGECQADSESSTVGLVPLVSC